MDPRWLVALIDAMTATPQVTWDERTARWRPRGRAVVCVVEGGASLDEPLVTIDELELTLGELGRMLSDHGAPVCLVFLDD